MQGICALFAVNFIGKFIDVHIPVNYWTLGLSSVGGVSGVILMLLCDIFIC
jgi:pro-sigmaK processing inhibitor BofA